MSISRNTKTVKLLLKLFDKENNALSVVDLVSVLSQEMNKTTVYRILQRLEEAGILHSFIDKDEKRVCLKRSLLFSSEFTFTESNLFVIVAVLSSAASIPLPFDNI